jgi:hypothetical protein
MTSEMNTVINSEIKELLENQYTNTIFKLPNEKKESILFVNDLSNNNIFYDISNNIYPHAFNYNNQIIIDYIGLCYANYGNYPTGENDYFYILLLDVSPKDTNYMLMKAGYSNNMQDRKKSVIYQYLPPESKTYVLYWSKDIPEYVEKKLHKNLHEKYPKLAYLTIKPNKKKDKEKKSVEIYIYNQNIMNECYNYVENYRVTLDKNIKKMEIKEKTKQIEFEEKTKQIEFETKQVEFEEKTKQVEFETKQVEFETKQVEYVEKTKQSKEKTKQMSLELEILKLKLKAKDNNIVDID